MPREPHPNDRDDWLWEEEECPWYHWRHAVNPRVRVFPPQEGDDRWMVATYEVREDGQGYPTHQQIFDGENAQLQAFLAGDQLAHPLKHPTEDQGPDAA